MSLTRYHNRPLHFGTREYLERERLSHDAQQRYDAKISKPGYKPLPHAQMLADAKEGNQRHLADAKRRREWNKKSKEKALNNMKNEPSKPTSRYFE